MELYIYIQKYNIIMVKGNISIVGKKTEYFVIRI